MVVFSVGNWIICFLKPLTFSSIISIQKQELCKKVNAILILYKTALMNRDRTKVYFIIYIRKPCFIKSFGVFNRFDNNNTVSIRILDWLNYYSSLLCSLHMNLLLNKQQSSFIIGNILTFVIDVF